MAIAAVITSTSSTKRKASPGAADGDTERRKRRVLSANKPNSTSDGLLTPAVCDFNTLSLGSPVPFSKNGALAPVAQMEIYYPLPIDCPSQNSVTADASVGHHNDSDLFVPQNDDCVVIDVGDDGYKMPPDLERELFGPPVEELLRMDAEAAVSSQPVQL
ncbi:hypothetical protein HMPREF1624_05073 [Sporothrix schenckii ATCC 58251]|uniref:Uncharacterized protein n=1 Tax=Sporothrix schenckii (strain ATCC 58251 / de Perez 2211183) TaxID=1391915 RepID=U7PU53_SPOS1|nr:hypothetical protein HMPREF1624_05073 [Sporothrix schenckii ATCC 58251]